MTGLLFGCATAFHPGALSDLKPGMSREAVVALLGQPDSDKKTVDGKEVLTYSYSESFMYDSGSDTSRLIRSSFDEKRLEKSLQTETYLVTLVDGKMVEVTKKK
jgi:hypothetical protein